MLDSLFELMAETIVAPIVNLAFAAIWWVVRNSALLAIYPVMLGTGWLRLWLRERGRLGLCGVWRLHGPAGLHRFGWQAAALDIESLCATVLIMLAGTGVGLVAYSILSQWFL